MLNSVSIVIPAYNEEGAIGQVIDDVKKVMDGADYQCEIIVVDDASTDKTQEIALSKNVKVIRHTINKGSGAARKTGVLNAKGDVIVMLDGDGTYNASDIPRLLSFFPEYDQVNGARTSEQGTLKFLRVPAKWFIRKLACYLTGIEIPDLNTGLKAFKKDIMKRYLWVVPDGFSCVTTMTLAFLCNGYSIKYISVDYKKRVGKSKFHPIKDTNQYIQTVIRMVMYFNPLKIFLPLSASIFIFGVLKTLYDWFFVVKRMQASDIVIIMTAIIVGVLGLISDLIVVQGKRRDFE